MEDTVKYNYTTEEYDLAMTLMLNAEPGIKSAVVFCGPDIVNCKHRVKITRIYKGKMEYRVCFGAPNYWERLYLNKCKKDKTTPKRTWLRPYPTKRSKDEICKK